MENLPLFDGKTIAMKSTKFRNGYLKHSYVKLPEADFSENSGHLHMIFSIFKRGFQSQIDDL